jgi:hypothetical protein
MFSVSLSVRRGRGDVAAVVAVDNISEEHELNFSELALLLAGRLPKLRGVG